MDIDFAYLLGPPLEETVSKHYSTARRVVKRMAQALEVELMHVRPPPHFSGRYWGDNFSEDACQHPSIDVAFDPRSRKVFYSSPAVELHLYLPHEIVHAVWPTFPEGADEEWECGMMTYEAAWLQRLCRTPTKRKLLRCWGDYAKVGRDSIDLEDEELEEISRDFAENNNLPSPWRA